MTAYELTFICRPEMSDSNHKTLVEKLRGIITSHTGEVIAQEDWGRRRLAYPIAKESKGLYTHLVFSGNNTLIAELERNLRINEQVIRFMSVKTTEHYDAKEYKYKPSNNIQSTVVPSVSPVQSNG